eukprot:5469083-Amphidinium_carterae.1
MAARAVATAKAMATGHELVSCEYTTKSGVAAGFSIVDLPVQRDLKKSTAFTLTHLIEVYRGLTTIPDLTQVADGGETWQLVKHITNPARVLHKKLEAACRGELLVPDSKALNTAPRMFPIVLQSLLEQLGGDSITSNEIKPITQRKHGASSVAAASQGPTTEGEIDEGFAFISKYAPTSTGEIEHLSPVHDWRATIGPIGR